MVATDSNQVKNELEKSFLLCQNYLQTLSQVTFTRSDILQWFQGLCQHLTKTISLIGRYSKEPKDKSLNPGQSTLLLYLTQTLTSLSLLINIFVCEEEIQLVVIEARKCVIKQLTCCLESIQVAVDCGKYLTDPSGNFVKWMDAALDKISEVNMYEDRNENDEVYEEARHLFEEVLSHAMSIAQVSVGEDGRVIRGSCQAVLSALNALDKEKNFPIPNASMINLLRNACSDKLCLLEKKVNIVVLKLCLKTFSQYITPLEKIQDFCFNAANKTKTDELDALVADFDLHVDRIMQIGLFAVSCSTNFGRGIKIRSYLASLEALESELVPALTSVLLDNSVHNVNCALLLMRHWLNQAVSLQRLIYLIIDPFAFCQIIYEEGVDIVDNLSSSIRKKILIKQNDIYYFILTVKVLHNFLDSAKSEFNEDELRKVQAKLKDFNEILQETESASKVLLSDQNINLDNCKRVLKRCKILLTVMKRLWFCFADESPNKNVLPELAPKFENLQLEPTGNPFLDHIINRGKQILQDRSVLYKTPVKTRVSKNLTNENKQKKKEMPLSRLVHLRKLSFANAAEKSEASLDLQITEILNEMTNLSTSLQPIGS